MAAGTPATPNWTPPAAANVYAARRISWNDPEEGRVVEELSGDELVEAVRTEGSVAAVDGDVDGHVATKVGHELQLK